MCIEEPLSESPLPSLSSPGQAHDHEGFYILNTLLEFADLNALAQYLGAIWGVLFTRLQSTKTPKFVRSLTVFVGLFAAKHSPAALEESINKVQPGAHICGARQTTHLRLLTPCDTLATKVSSIGKSPLTQFMECNPTCKKRMWFVVSSMHLV